MSCILWYWMDISLNAMCRCSLWKFWASNTVLGNSSLSADFFLKSYTASKNFTNFPFLPEKSWQLQKLWLNALNSLMWSYMVFQIKEWNNFGEKIKKIFIAWPKRSTVKIKSYLLTLKRKLLVGVTDINQSSCFASQNFSSIFLLPS